MRVTIEIDIVVLKDMIRELRRRAAEIERLNRIIAMMRKERVDCELRKAILDLDLNNLGLFI
jgi:hypothetical protein